MEQPPRDPSGFSMVRQHRRMLAGMGFYLNGKSRILDFGCGTGGLVYEYRDAGFDAYGFDLVPTVQLRRSEDAAFFRFSPEGAPREDVADYRVDRGSYTIPFEDASFDFVFSTSVFEHVKDHDAALAEIARVLKPGGVAIHTFPPRYCLIEPHTYVPLAGRIQCYPWFLLWALFGIRNEHQRDLGPFERARRNATYARIGVNYLTTRQILAVSSRHFRVARFVPHLWEVGDGGFVHPRGAWTVLSSLHRSIYNNFRMAVLFLRK